MDVDRPFMSLAMPSTAAPLKAFRRASCQRPSSMSHQDALLTAPYPVAPSAANRRRLDEFKPLTHYRAYSELS